MSSANERISVDHHDWHSPSYVDEWIARDLTRDEERRLRLRQMLAAAPFAADGEITVLDVGGGYGVVTEEVLRAFPRAVVTLAGLFAADAGSGAAAARGPWRAGQIRDRRSARSGMDRWGRRPVRPRRLGDRDPQSARSRADRRLLSGDRRGAEARRRVSRLRSVRSDRRDRRADADDRARPALPRSTASGRRPPLAIVAARDPRRPGVNAISHHASRELAHRDRVSHRRRRGTR